jgi:hypothetical protein
MDDEPGPWVRCVIESDRPGYSNGMPSFIIGGGAKKTLNCYLDHYGNTKFLYEHYVYRTIFNGFKSL